MRRYGTGPYGTKHSGKVRSDPMPHHSAAGLNQIEPHVAVTSYCMRLNGITELDSLERDIAAGLDVIP